MDISKSHRVNFNQNLRTADDFAFKHAISTAVLTAMISQHIRISQEDREALIAAALLYGYGYRFVPRHIMDKVTELSPLDVDTVQLSLEKGLSYLRVFHDEFPFLAKTLSIIEYYILSANPERKYEHPSESVLLLAEILKIAQQFDLMTGMSLGHQPESEILAMNYLREHPGEYNDTLVLILSQCIHIIPAGASVDLSTKDKAIVLVENPKDYMKPVILRLSNNKVYDLSDPAVAEKIQIIDLMKTMDNRIEIDEDTVKQFVADPRIIEITNRFREIKKASTPKL